MKRITISIITILAFTAMVHGVIYMNYICNTLQPEQCNNEALVNTVNIGDLQIEASAAYLSAESQFKKFLEKLELTEISLSSYQEQSSILTDAIERMSNAERNFDILYTEVQRFSLNQMVLEDIKEFDYKGFCCRNKLNPIIMNNVEEYLSKGNIFGLLQKTRDDCTGLRKSLEGLKTTIDEGTKDINAIYQINQNFADTSLFGQYAAMVFREVITL
jgi:hypothetical protein